MGEGEENGKENPPNNTKLKRVLPSINKQMKKYYKFVIMKHLLQAYPR